MPFELPQRIPPTTIRQVNIEEQQVGWLPQQRIGSFRRGPGLPDRVPAGLEVTHDHAPEEGLVLDHQDRSAHALPPDVLTERCPARFHLVQYRQRALNSVSTSEADRSTLAQYFGGSRCRGSERGLPITTLRSEDTASLWLHRAVGKARGVGSHPA